MREGGEGEKKAEAMDTCSLTNMWRTKKEEACARRWMRLPGGDRPAAWEQGGAKVTVAVASNWMEKGLKEADEATTAHNDSKACERTGKTATMLTQVLPCMTCLLLATW